VNATLIDEGGSPRGRKLMKNILTALVAAFLLAVPTGIVTSAKAHHDGDTFQAGDIIVSHLWTNATSATSDAIEVYMTILNTGTEADELIAATTRFSGPGKLQATTLQDGALRVVEAPTFELAPGQAVSFQPGGITLVLPGVQRVLREGDHFHMTLEFAQAGAITVDVNVEGPVEADDHDHDHDHDDHGHSHDTES
jgi:copper(I)-binding protein